MVMTQRDHDCDRDAYAYDPTVTMTDGYDPTMTVTMTVDVITPLLVTLRL
jgi:hypothetical protein